MKRREDADRGVGGEVGDPRRGFYRVEKFKVAPGELPEPLHWFKWEAYTTWLSGFGLLIILYYLNPETYLLDRRVADISAPQAVAISVGILFVGWLVYDGLPAAGGAGAAAGGGDHGGDRAGRLGIEPTVQPAGGLHPGGGADRHLDGVQRVLHHHPGPAAARGGDAGGQGAGPGSTGSAASSDRSTTTT